MGEMMTMLIDHPDLDVNRSYEYYFLGEGSGKYCQFMSDRELAVGSIVVIEDYLFSTLVYKIVFIEEINEKTVVKFEDFQVALCRQTLVKYDV